MPWMVLPASIRRRSGEPPPVFRGCYVSDTPTKHRLGTLVVRSKAESDKGPKAGQGFADDLPPRNTEGRMSQRRWLGRLVGR